MLLCSLPEKALTDFVYYMDTHKLRITVSNMKNANTVRATSQTPSILRRPGMIKGFLLGAMHLSSLALSVLSSFLLSAFLW